MTDLKEKIGIYKKNIFMGKKTKKASAKVGKKSMLDYLCTLK